MSELGAKTKSIVGFASLELTEDQFSAEKTSSPVRIVGRRPQVRTAGENVTNLFKHRTAGPARTVTSLTSQERLSPRPCRGTHAILLGVIMRRFEVVGSSRNADARCGVEAGSLSFSVSPRYNM